MSETLITGADITPDEIKNRLLLPYCTFKKNAVKIDLEGNSIVFCSQWFRFLETAKECFPNIQIEDIKIGVNFVEINGKMPEGEELHVHISMMIAIATEGKGILIYEKEGKEIIDIVEKGDMFFVPKNALHYFEGDPVFKFAAIEFGPTIDYQKHHYTKQN